MNSNDLTSEHCKVMELDPAKRYIVFADPAHINFDELATMPISADVTFIPCFKPNEHVRVVEALTEAELKEL